MALPPSPPMVSYGGRASGQRHSVTGHHAAVAALLAAGLLAMAVAGAPSAGPGEATTAANSNGSEVGASAQSRLTHAP